MLKNPNEIKLVQDTWYLCKRGKSPSTPLRYTESTEDAYYVSHLFSDECNLTIENEMKVIPND